MYSRENKEKSESTIRLYVIACRDSIYSIAEAIDDSNNRPYFYSLEEIECVKVEKFLEGKE